MALLKIPVTKAGRNIEVDTDAIPEAMFTFVVEEGLKVVLNKGLTGTKFATKGLEGEALTKAQFDCFERAEKNFADLMEGKLKRGRATATTDGKVPAKVITEARRLAKEVVKNEIRAAGMKISHVEASEITKLANEMISTDPSFIEQAKANLEAATVKTTALNIASLIHESPALVAKADKAKAERKAERQLSAAKAGKVAPRKGAVPASAH